MTQQAVGKALGKDILKVEVMSLGAVSRNLFHQKKKKTSGLTHGDDFVVTGTKGSLLEPERVSNQSKHHRSRFDKEHRSVESEREGQG